MATTTTTTVTHPDGTTVVCSTEGAAAPPKDLKLMYFDGRGLMELPRTLLAVAGRFPGADYEDFRYPVAFEDGQFKVDEFKAARDSGEHGSWNLSRVPLCIADGVTIGQGKAIARYIAKAHGLMGVGLGQEGQIDTICEHVAEMGDFFKKLTTDEQKAAWFDTPATAVGQPAAADKSDRQLQFFLGHIEECVGGDGYSVGGTISLADATIYSKLGETAADAGSRGEIMGNTAAASAVIAKYPKISAIIQTFRDSPGMVKWLAMRGPQKF